MNSHHFSSAVCLPNLISFNVRVRNTYFIFFSKIRVTVIAGTWEQIGICPQAQIKRSRHNWAIAKMTEGSGRSTDIIIVMITVCHLVTDVINIKVHVTRKECIFFLLLLCVLTNYPVIPCTRNGL